MDNVRIESSAGKVYEFICKKWLDKHEDDGKTERTLYPNEETLHYESRMSRDSSREHGLNDQFNDDFRKEYNRAYVPYSIQDSSPKSLHERSRSHFDDQYVPRGKFLNKIHYFKMR